MKYCAVEPGRVTTTGDLSVFVENGLDVLVNAETVIVPGTHGRDDIDPRVLDALCDAAARGHRIVSICTGAFILAAAGPLDGRPATTHWNHATLFTSRYPEVQLDLRVLYVDDGQVFTSAGLAAGIDLCLHFVRQDFGAAVANESLAMRWSLPSGPAARLRSSPPRYLLTTMS